MTAMRRAFKPFFQQVTGKAPGLEPHAGTRAESKAEARPEPARSSQVGQTGMITSESPVPTTPPRLAANPGDRVAGATPDDDLLDIPAFLRRQAN